MSIEIRLFASEMALRDVLLADHVPVEVRREALDRFLREAQATARAKLAEQKVTA